jgi:two-component system phosphate regulon sensor histidine kinase PhoR
MSQQAERMGHLVADLLTLARLEGSPRPGATAGSRRRAASLTSRPRRARFRRAPCHRRSRGGGAQIAGDESELQSAVGNLVSNAVRYTPEGGRIEVGWRIGRQTAVARSR